MARNPALQALRRLVSDHRDARLMRMPVDELRGMRAEAAAEPQGMARRELFKRAGVLGLGVAGMAAVAASPAAPARAAAGARIAVIGAGISGLTAALTLQDAGIACTVYEANPTRVGGRMYSEASYWANGQTSEYGGELIDTGHKKILRLCRRFGLDTVDFAGSGPNGAEDILHFDGSYYPRTQADVDFNPVYQALHTDLQSAGEVMWNQATPSGIALDNMTIRQWIDSRVPGGYASKLGQFIDVAYAIEYGADTTLQSSLALVLLMGYQTNPGHFNIWGLSDERYHIVGGNDQLPKAIAAALPPIQMGWKLVAIKTNTDGTQTLTFDAGGTTKTVTADHTILTVPLPILQSLDYSKAGFDARMTALLGAAKMGYCTKLNMQFASRPWVGTGPWPGVSAGDCFTDLPFQNTWDTTKGQAGSSGILIQYGGGSPAYALNPSTPFSNDSTSYVRSLVNTVLTDVDKVYPGTKAKWNGKAALSAWHKNPYSLGAYSYWPTGYLHNYAGYEGVQQGNIHIAGEHTSYDFQGYMNGGATEGERAAREVIAGV